MLVDTHAHVNFNAFKDDNAQVLKDCLDRKTWVINVGSELKTSRRAVKIAERYEKGVYAIIGLHPVHLFEQKIEEEGTSFTTRAEVFDHEEYKKLSQSKKVVGIGETGLEYFQIPDGDLKQIKQKQVELFEQQIELAVETGKALMVHSRDAYDDIYKIIKKHRDKLRAVIIHSFIGSPEEAQKFIKLDCYISFNGIITYKPRKEKRPGQSDPNFLKAVLGAPLNRILLETDCPFLAPAPMRGKRNVPYYVKHTAEKLAEIKDVSFSEIAEQTTKNAREVFGI